MSPKHLLLRYCIQTEKEVILIFKRLLLKKKYFLLLSAVVIFLLIFVILSSKKEHELPTDYQFLPSTNSIHFSILNGYELYTISCDGSFFDTSKIKANDRAFNFDIGDMKVGQQEMVTISCKGQDDSINSVMYIILIQSKDELIIETYKNDFLVADNSFQIVR